jgi:hypothetical protein
VRASVHILVLFDRVFLGCGNVFRILILLGLIFKDTFSDFEVTSDLCISDTIDQTFTGFDNFLGRSSYEFVEILFVVRRTHGAVIGICKETVFHISNTPVITTVSHFFSNGRRVINGITVGISEVIVDVVIRGSKETNNFSFIGELTGSTETDIHETSKDRIPTRFDEDVDATRFHLESAVPILLSPPMRVAACEFEV